MVQSVMSARTIRLVLLLFAFPLTGCSMFTPSGPATYAYRISNQVPPAEPVDFGFRPSPQDQTTADDPLTNGGDPLTAADSLKGSATLAGTDPLTRDPTKGSDKTDRPINNWYWVRGTVQNGDIVILVNGQRVGSWSVKIDTEISDYLYKGDNQISFVSHPDVPDQPVQADLEVVYAQQQPGDLPVLTYNTTGESATNSNTLAPFTIGKQKPAIPGLPMPSIDAQPSDAAADGTTIQTFTFDAS